MQRCSFLFARFIALPMLDDTRVWANADAYCVDMRGPVLFEHPRWERWHRHCARWLASCKTIAQRPWPSPPACLNSGGVTP